MDGKQRRIAKYKEERRKQLAAQFEASILSNVASEKYSEHEQRQQQTPSRMYQSRMRNTAAISSSSVVPTVSVSAAVEKQHCNRKVVCPVSNKDDLESIKTRINTGRNKPTAVPTDNVEKQRKSNSYSAATEKHCFQDRNFRFKSQPLRSIQTEETTAADDLPHCDGSRLGERYSGSKNGRKDFNSSSTIPSLKANFAGHRNGSSSQHSKYSTTSVVKSKIKSTESSSNNNNNNNNNSINDDSVVTTAAAVVTRTSLTTSIVNSSSIPRRTSNVRSSHKSQLDHRLSNSKKNSTDTQDSSKIPRRLGRSTACDEYRMNDLRNSISSANFPLQKVEVISLKKDEYDYEKKLSSRLLLGTKDKINDNKLSDDLSTRYGSYRRQNDREKSSITATDRLSEIIADNVRCDDDFIINGASRTENPLNSYYANKTKNINNNHIDIIRTDIDKNRSILQVTENSNVNDDSRSIDVSHDVVLSYLNDDISYNNDNTNDNNLKSKIRKNRDILIEDLSPVYSLDEAVSSSIEQSSNKSSIDKSISSVKDDNDDEDDVSNLQNALDGRDVCRTAAEISDSFSPITTAVCCNNSNDCNDVEAKRSILKKKFSIKEDVIDVIRPSSILKCKSVENDLPDDDSTMITTAGKAGTVVTVAVTTTTTTITNNNNNNNSSSSNNNNIIINNNNNSARSIKSSGSKQRQGILKKYNSLDETRTRRRSYSPESIGRGCMYEFKPILKTQVQRRCSLEEVRKRTGHARPIDTELQSILKRKCYNDFDSPHGILKRKCSQTDNIDNNRNIDSVDIIPSCDDIITEQTKSILKKNHRPTTIDLDSAEDRRTIYHPATMKPILKKKSIAGYGEENFGRDSVVEQPKLPPILKTSSTHDADDNDRSVKNVTIKPILKRTESYGDNNYDDDNHNSVVRLKPDKRHSITSFRSFETVDRASFSKGRPLSVAERVITLESFLARETTDTVLGTGDNNRKLLDKRSTIINRRNDYRYKTQPITRDEIIHSTSNNNNNNNISFRRSNSNDYADRNKNRLLPNRSSLSSVDMDLCKNIDDFVHTDKTNDHDDDGQIIVDADSDEVAGGLRRSNSVSEKASLFTKLEQQAKKSAIESKVNNKSDERKKERKLRVKCAPSTGRFSTQPITSEEVQEAKRQNSSEQLSVKLPDVSENDEDASEPSKLSIAERVQLFSEKVDRLKRASVKRTGLRFKTQPITIDELLIAKNKSNATGIDRGNNSPNRDDLSLSNNSPQSSRKEGILTEKSRLDIEEGSTRISVSAPITAAALPSSTAAVTASGKDNFKLDIISRLDGIYKKTLSKNLLNDGELNDASSENTSIYSRSSSVEISVVDEDAQSEITAKKLDIEIDNDDSLSDDNVNSRSDNSESNLSTKAVQQNTKRQLQLPTGKCIVGILKSKSAILTSNDDKSIERRSVTDTTESATRLETRSPQLLVRKSASFREVQKEGERRNKMMNATAAVDLMDTPKTVNGRTSIAERLAALQRSGELEWKKRLSRSTTESDFSSLTGIAETQENLRKELMGVLNNNNNNNNNDNHRLYTDAKKDESLAERLGRLENASHGWKKRVEPSDAAQFSVAGKMAGTMSVLPPLSSSSITTDKKKKVPCPVRFKSRHSDSENTDIRSSPTSPEKSIHSSVTYNRSSSLPNGVHAHNTAATIAATDEQQRSSANYTVVVPQIFDDDFSTFFGTIPTISTSREISLSASGKTTTDDNDFDNDLERIKMSASTLLSTQRKLVKVQRKHACSSSNPIKTLASTGIIKQEYNEVKNNDFAEKEVKRINVERLSQNSCLAIEVLAGLASKEDFASISLKKAGSPIMTSMLPYKSTMLLHVKGRRHVQTRLIEPSYKAINSGDSYILVTANEIFHWIGSFSNVIERSRSAEIVQHIITTHDLGCSADSVSTIVEDRSSITNSKQERKFWSHLGVSDEDVASIKATAAGHPDEDELYESALISTNMIYEASDEELIPIDKYWGAVPKIEMLDPNKVLVFDFGSELYVWMGKNIDMKRRKSSVRLAKELWDQGYNYSECDTCPITSFLTVGHPEISTQKLNDRLGKERPSWCLQAKITQHMETVLFREKFLDWPDFTRVIRAKGKDEDTEKQTDPSLDLKPCDVKEMLEYKPAEPDLQLEGNHLGRGTSYYDEQLRRYYSVTTLDVRMWRIAEYESKELAKESLGQFHTEDSYIVRWHYSVTFTGRELSGLPSRHSVTGRDRYAYFCWQGRNASLNEQGAAALLTVELDKEKGPQIRITEGNEIPAFCNLFAGKMVVYKNKRDTPSENKWRLYVCRGEVENEAVLMEVSCNIRQLRSRSSFLLVNTETNVLYIWHGIKSADINRKVCVAAVKKLTQCIPPEFRLNSKLSPIVTEIFEGGEPKEFFEGVNNTSRKLYLSLLNDKCQDVVRTLSLFHLSSGTGKFKATPVSPPRYHSTYPTAYPFLQQDLYSVARQPALFLLDTGNELWLWQGWWPEYENNENIETADSSITNDGGSTALGNHRGTATTRWQAERRTAMQTSLDYWKAKYATGNNGGETFKAYLVWAGLEPLQFTNLFPDWDDRDDIAEINIKDGRKPGEILPVEQELARLTQSTYPLEQLLQRPLPDGVDPTKLELYLPSQYFQDVLKTTKEEFLALPLWKQTNIKKSAGLF